METSEEELQKQKRKREVEEEVRRKRMEAEQLKQKQIAAEELKRKQEWENNPKRPEIDKRQRYVDWCNWQKDPLKFAHDQSLLPPEKKSTFHIPAEGDRWQYDAELNDICWCM
jgi:hypothetical protein